MMENKKAHWGVLAVFAFIVLLMAAHALLPPPKARASRIQSVNHIASVSITMPSTNGLPAATTSK